MAKENKTNKEIRKKQIRQTELPKVSLQEALKVAEAIWEQYAGTPTEPIFVAQAVGISPSSSNWRVLSGASVAYGLTDGGYNSKEISLTELGKKIVSPTEENEDKIAKFESAQKPTFFKKFYEKYGNNNKLPIQKIGENLLVSWGIPKDEASKAYKLIIENGEFSGIIVEIQGNKYVNLSYPKNNLISTNYDNNFCDDYDKIDGINELPDSLLKNMNIEPTDSKSELCNEKTINNKVFISHGKNKEVVNQLKQLLEFGAFEPVISVERETTAIPVPDKVFNDMRMCTAGIIHIEGEKELLDSDGNTCTLINENVLIEIGAAIALFNSKVILLCKKGIQLPSNLQGLYRCEYDGEKLEYDSTMKLLKTFSEFRKQ